MIHVSVVVPTVGRYSPRGVLDALADQVSPPPFEVIVGVDGDTYLDVTGLVRHSSCTRVVVVRLGTPQGVSVARNFAVAQASGEIIGFLDDDTVPEPDWLNRLGKDLSGQDAAIAGRIIEQSGETVLGRLRAVAFNHRHVSNLAQLSNLAQPCGNSSLHVDYLNGGNCGIRTEVFRALSGFDPTFRKSQDRELARRIVQAGYTIAYDPELVITHAASYTAKGFLRGRYRAGRAAGLMARSNSTSVGPTTLRDTYGGNWFGLARQHGISLATMATISILAYWTGRVACVVSSPVRGPRSTSRMTPVSIDEVHVPVRG